ncbi:MAG: hypothetical protein MJB14_01040, partial [Spirochaetes bacterium]|nr:hypothetical protein [Spirochaetota bacterium]
ILGITFGSISGYIFGYWLATIHAKPKKGSQEYVDIIRDEINWLYIKDKMFSEKYSTLARKIDKIKDEQVKTGFIKKIDDIFDTIELDRNINLNYKSHDYFSIEKIDDEVSRII